MVSSKSSSPPTADRALGALPPQVRDRLEAFRHTLRDSLGDNLEALLIYGSVAFGAWHEGTSDVDVMIVLRDDRREVLDAIGHEVRLARYAARIEAMILRRDEIASAADVFPLLYDDVRECNILLAGEDPFKGLVIRDAYRRLRVEQELREARIRLRRMVADSERGALGLRDVVRRKLKQLRSPLRALLRLRGEVTAVDLDSVIRAACAAYAIDADALLQSSSPTVSYDLLTSLIDAAISDVDARDEGAPGT
jgi:predicted nucleotidyltransferase